MSKDLRTVSDAEFAQLKDGHYYYAIPGPSGDMQRVTLSLHGGRRKLRQACFDLFSTEWAIRREAVEVFAQDCRQHLRSRTGLFKWNKVQIPGGHSHLAFSIIRGEEGEWLHKAAQFVADYCHLGPKSPRDGRDWAEEPHAPNA